MVETLNALAYVAAPVLAGILYEWRPKAIFSVGLEILLLTIILALIFLRRRRVMEGAQDEA
jgi:hypothetical protein